MNAPTPYEEYEIALATKIACAAISHQMDISYQTYWKNYTKDSEGNPRPVGTAWIELARFVQKHLFRKIPALANPTLSVKLLELAETLPDEDLILAISFLEGRAEHYRQNPEARP